MVYFFEELRIQLANKGISSKAIDLLESFLSTSNFDQLASLLERSEIGTKGIDELQFVKDRLDSVGLKSAKLVFDITLARGLDYYTGSILEVKAKDVNVGSIGGGGRYDDLTSIFGLKDVSGVGISFGIDRIYLVMEELGLFPDNISFSTQVMFVNFGAQEAKFCLPLLKEIRNKGISAELYPKADKMKKQMNYANNKQVQFVVLVGENEMKSGILSVKDMNSGEQKNMDINALIKELS